MANRFFEDVQEREGVPTETKEQTKGGTKAIIIVSIIIGCLIQALIIGSIFDGGDTNLNTSDTEASVINTPTSTITPKPTPTPINYIKYDLEELFNLLKNYPIKAEDLTGQYIEVEGYLSNVDTDGKYFSITATNDAWDWDSFQWDIKSKNSDVYNTIKDTAMDSKIIVRGKITNVGEILGFYGDADEVIVVK